MAQDLVIGIDVGGQTAKCGVVDARGNIIAQTVISSENTTNADEFVAALAEALNRIIVEAKAEGSIRGIGVGIPNGNFYTGVVENAVNLVWAQGGNKGLTIDGNAAELLSQGDNGNLNFTGSLEEGATYRLTVDFTGCTIDGNAITAGQEKITFEKL